MSRRWSSDEQKVEIRVVRRWRLTKSAAKNKLKVELRVSTRWSSE